MSDSTQQPKQRPPIRQKNIFGLRNDERFIFKHKKHKKFKIKMSKEEFKRAYAARGLGGSRHHIPWIDADLPKHDVKNQYIKKLQNTLWCLEKSHQEELTKMTKEIDQKFMALKAPLMRAIKKLESQVFLENGNK